MQSLNPTENFFYSKYKAYFDAITKKTSINSDALLKFSFDLVGDKPKLQKANNFFAIARGNKYNAYQTPFDGIQGGVDLFVNNPMYDKLKIGTLKANPIKQLEKLKLLLPS
jgi:cell division septation protein DedD